MGKENCKAGDFRFRAVEKIVGYISDEFYSEIYNLINLDFMTYSRANKSQPQSQRKGAKDVEGINQIHALISGEAELNAGIDSSVDEHFPSTFGFH